MKYTPGPWKVAPFGRLVRVEAAKHFGICHVLRNTHGPAKEDSLCIANAYLIAMAPDMLEELKRIVEMDMEDLSIQYDNDWPVIRALIKRAENRKEN